MNLTNMNATEIETFVKDFDNVKDMIRLVPKSNDAFEDGEYRTPFACDMDISYYIYIDENRTARVKKNLVDTWGVPESKLVEIAFKNTKKTNDYEYFDLMDFTNIMLFDDKNSLKRSVFDVKRRPNQQITVTNKARLKGSYVLLDKKTLKKISDYFGGDFYIFPSSIHEVLVSDVDESNKQEFASFVRQINKTEVSKNEKLSDYLLRYVSATEEIVKEA